VSSLGDWLDERTGYRALVRRALDQPVPGGARWSYVWGSALVLLLVIEAVTGVLLMTAYAPSATTAWPSVAYISRSLPAGWIIRGLHYWAAQAMIVLLAAHLVQKAIFGGYKKPREVNWYLGLGLLMIILGLHQTGYRLPWDQNAYWSTRVVSNIVASIPLIGRPIQELILGGAEPGHMTITRLYALHVAVLPALAMLLFALHYVLFRRHGYTPQAEADVARAEPVYPRQAARNIVVGLVVLAVLFALTFKQHGAPLEAPTDPSSDFPARPEWYFVAVFELRKYVHGILEPIVTVGVMVLVFGYLFALPFLDKRPGRSITSRLSILAPLVFFGVAAVGLSIKSTRDDAANADFVKANKIAAERAERALVLFDQGVPPEGPLAMLRADPDTRGPELFAQHCASCHRLGDLAPEDGKIAGPDLTGFGSKAWILGLLDNPDADRFFGKTPFSGMMPSMVHPPSDPEAAKAFTPMSPADQDAIAAFLEAEAKGQGGKGMPGEKMVRQRCTSCHRLDGQTDDDESLGPELRGWASVAWIEAQLEDPGSGKAYPKGAMAADLKGHMPAFKETLSAAERKLLAVWIAKKGQATAAR